MSEQINVQLKKPIEYDFKGEKTEATFVTVSSPTTKHIHLTSVLKQAFQVSAMKVSEDRRNSGLELKEKDDESEDRVTPSEAVSLIYIGGDSVKIEKIMLTGVQLLTSGIVLVEGEQKLTKPLCEELSQEDFEEILGTVLVNFIIASLLDSKS